MELITLENNVCFFHLIDMYAARFVVANKTGSNIIATAHQKITRANLILNKTVYSRFFR